MTVMSRIVASQLNLESKARSYGWVWGLCNKSAKFLSTCTFDFTVSGWGLGKKLPEAGNQWGLGKLSLLLDRNGTKASSHFVIFKNTSILKALFSAFLIICSTKQIIVGCI